MKKYILLILLAGCVVSKPSYPPLPPTPTKQTRKTFTEVKTFSGKIGLSWTNNFIADSTNYISYIEGSSNLVNWISLMRIPYATTNFYILTNQPSTYRFYRVYNGTSN